ncbi:MAG: hypothetical protein HDR17_02310 [Lachnospiraceae bacterium]|nr:hypothetical protein [Lachnospiraceae bacterium]
MPKENIKYKCAVVTGSIALGHLLIQSGLENRLTEYDNILAGFSVSDSMHAEALRDMIKKEKALLETIISFYKQMLDMLQNASRDLEKTEQDYSSSHVESTGE